MLTEISLGPKAWVGNQLQPDDWRLEIPADCRAELDATAELLGPDPGPDLEALTRLSPASFDLAHCRAFTATVRDRLARFPGFVILDRLPVEGLSKAQATALYWLLAGLVGRPVAQAYCGTLLYDVHDTGKKIAPTVRGDLTNQELYWHTDYGFNRMPPHEIGLLVLQTAREGGVSQMISFHTVHNEMLRRHPALLPRLYRTFHWNRQREHAPGEPLTYRHPIFSYDGALRTRFNRRLIKVGHEIVGEPLDKQGADALEAMIEILEDPALRVEFVLEPGQIQLVNNLEFCHRRTAYLDDDDPARRRHLVRIFLRDEGGPGYDG
jgi:alpha-ketoglutarate-dependent taurine dioxygenase